MLHHSVIDNQHLQYECLQFTHMLVSSVLSQSYCSLLHQKSCVLRLLQKNNILTRSMQMKELHNTKIFFKKHLAWKFV